MSGVTYPRQTKIAAVQQYIAGTSFHRTARDFGTTATSIKNWWKEYIQTGDIHETLRERNAPTRVSVSASLELELKDWVFQKAEQHGTTMSGFLRKVIIALYKQEKRKEREKRNDLLQQSQIQAQ